MVLEINRVIFVIIGISLLFITSEIMGVTNLINDNDNEINKQSKYIVEREITEINDSRCDYSFHGDTSGGAVYFCEDTKFGDCSLLDDYSNNRKYLMCEN